MPKQSKKTGQSTVSAPTAAAPKGAVAVMTKNIETLRAELAQAEAFAKWAATADDDEAPALLFYPKPTGKGVWSWQAKASYDAQQASAALKAALTAEAAKPKPAQPSEPSELSEDELPRYVAPAEPAEVTAARLARYSADGRSPSGVLLCTGPCAGPCACKSCSSAAKQVRMLSDAECQAAVDIFGWEHGAELILAQNEGWSMDDLYGVEMQNAWEAYCSAMRASQVAREAEEKARIEANWRRACVEQAMVEARRCLKRGEAVQKNGRICTRCYSCEGNKNTDWEDGGKKARPSTLHVSSECFTHAEFLAGRIREDCPFLHSGDAGWHAEWDRNFLWDPIHPESMPVPKHIRKREGDAALCISEKSSGYLPVHLGGKEQGMDARQWRNSGPTATQARFSSLVGSAEAPKKAWGKK